MKEQIKPAYRISDLCIGCDLCQEIAPDNIKSDLEKGVALIIKQPEKDNESDLISEAAEICPVNAIGRI